MHNYCWMFGLFGRVLANELKLVSVLEIQISLTVPGKIVLFLYKYRSVSLFVFFSSLSWLPLRSPLEVLKFLNWDFSCKIIDRNLVLRSCLMDYSCIDGDCTSLAVHHFKCIRNRVVPTVLLFIAFTARFLPTLFQRQQKCFLRLWII